MAKKSTLVTVSYTSNTVKNYVTTRYDFGMQVESTEVFRAKQLCEAVVKFWLGQTTGMRRSQLDSMTSDLTDCDTFAELTGGEGSKDEIV